MKNLRKVLALIIAMAMIMGVVGCASKKKPVKYDDKKSSEEEDEDDDEDEDEDDEDEDDKDDEDDEDDDSDDKDTDVTKATKETEETEETDETEETEETDESKDDKDSSVNSKITGDNKAKDFVDYLSDKGYGTLVEGTDLHLDEFADGNLELYKNGMIVYAEGDDVASVFDIYDQFSDTGMNVTSAEVGESWNMEHMLATGMLLKADFSSDANSFFMYTVSAGIYFYDSEEAAADAFEQSINSGKIDVSLLSSDEYSFDGSTGYYIVHLDIDDFITLMSASAGDQMTDDLKEQYKALLGDFEMVSALYLDGDSIYQVFLTSTVGQDESIKKIVSDYGFKDPFSVECSDAILEAVGGQM